MKSIHLVSRLALASAFAVTALACGASPDGSSDPSSGAASLLGAGTSGDDGGVVDPGQTPVVNGGGKAGSPAHSPSPTPFPSPSPSPSPSPNPNPPPPPAPPPAGGSPTLAGCTMFPADNPWNRDVSNDPVDAALQAQVWSGMHTTAVLHADWGTHADQAGIPFIVSNASPQVLMTWTTSWGKDESDPLACGLGPFCYPIPANAPIEQSGDAHVLVLDTSGAPSNCTLYELYAASKNPSDSGWSAQNGAVFHLGTNALRPDGWTSSDAAGLPVLPGLVRYDEAMSGAIHHALRFTLPSSFNGYIHPATHGAGYGSTALPPMGLRVRLRASFDTTGLSGPALAIVTAMKRYGLFLADNGESWYVTGDENDAWAAVKPSIDAAFANLHGSDFEVVQTGTVSTAGL